MIMLDATWQLQGRNLGTGRAGEFTKHGARHWPASTTFVCPDCGALWARITVARQRFFPIRRACPRCGPGFILPFDLENYPVIPKKALQYEILRLSLFHDPKQYSIHLISQGQ